MGAMVLVRRRRHSRDRDANRGGETSSQRACATPRASGRLWRTLRNGWRCCGGESSVGTRPGNRRSVAAGWRRRDSGCNLDATTARKAHLRKWRTESEPAAGPSVRAAHRRRGAPCPAWWCWIAQGRWPSSRVRNSSPELVFDRLAGIMTHSNVRGPASPLAPSRKRS